MDDHKVLEHLLSLETQAAALVDDAQAEAEKRITEGEKQSRAGYDEIYTREAAALEASYVKNIAVVKEDYRKQVEAYRESLNIMPLDKAAFSSLAEKLLLSAVPSSKEA